MTKIGIIRCQELNHGLSKNHCAGHSCFGAIRDKTGYLDEYDDDIDLVGFDTCGGCPGKNRTDKIVQRGLDLKKHGAEVIHLSTCISLFCPNRDMFADVLKEKVGLSIREMTHGRPDGKRLPVGPDGKPVFRRRSERD